MRVMMLTLLWLALMPALVSAQDEKSLANQARTILKRYCHQCPSGPGSDSGEEFDVLKLDTLTAKTAERGPVVLAGQPEKSNLFKAIAKRMPPKNIKDRPSDEEKAILEKWIKAGAPGADKTERKFLPIEHVLSSIRAHQQDVAAKQAIAVPFRRYFTLTHLHNNADVSDEDLAVYRAALGKALNSLHWQRQVTVPQAIDKEGTIYSVDLRDLGWDRGRLWQELLKLYPYGLSYQAHPDQSLRKLDRDVAQAAGATIAHVRADWFTANATRPPLYHTLLELPHSDWQLENKLGVDVRANFERAKLARAGFSKSGVSGQNRLLERHEALYGAYWKSYDFKEKSQRNDLRQFPLGPLNLFPDRKHPYLEQAFVHDGGELIFNLPNGLQGYFLIKGNGDRIDQGPEDVVSDSLKTSGTNAIVNGLSCMACHVNGSIPFKDQLREGAAVFGQAKNKVADLYPISAVMDKRVREDEERFLSATHKVLRPFLAVGDNQAALKKNEPQRHRDHREIQQG